MRGRILAEDLGCFGCHQPDGGKEIPNPQSRWGTIPRFQAGNAFMYGPSAKEVEEFIRFGAPREWLESPAAQDRLTNQLVQMPAYGNILSDAQVDDLVRFITALEGIGLAEHPTPIVEGRRLARLHGCTSCHGIAGSGGVSNPGSLGGFIPGFVGHNFEHLVTDRAEFVEWVQTGRLERLAANPVIAFFWQRQSIDMPAYTEILTTEEIDSIWAWVQFLRTSHQNASPVSEIVAEPPAAS